MPEVVLPPYLQSVLALRPPLATSTRTDLAPSFKLLHSTVNSIYGVSGIHGLEPGLWRAQLIRITLRSAQLVEAVWTKLGGQGGVIIDDQGQGGRGVMKLQSVFSDLQMFIASLAALQDPLSTILLDPAAFSRTQATVTSLSKKILALIQHYNVADILPTPIDQWPEEDAEDKEEDRAALPVLIAKSRPSKAILQTFQDKYAQRDQVEPSSSTSSDNPDQDAQATSNPLASSTSSATPSLHSSSYANSGLSTANRSDFLRFVYSQNPNLIGNQGDLDTAVAAGTAALSSMTFASKVSSKSPSSSQAGYKPRKSLVQQRISSFASSTDAPPPLPSSTLNPYNSPRRVVSDNPNASATRKSWTVDMSGLNGIQRQASLSSSKPPSHPAPSTQVLVAAPQPSWKSSASRSASIKSRSSSIAESLSYRRSSSGDISDLKHKPTGHIQGHISEHGDAPTSGEKEGASKAPPPPTFAEQAAAIVAARKQRAISSSSSPSLAPKERHFSPSRGDSNDLTTSRKHSIPSDTNSASESSGAAISSADVPKSTQPHAVPERASSSNSGNSVRSGSVSTSSSTTASIDVTVMLPAETTVTETTSSLETSIPSLSTSPTTYTKADSMLPSTSGSSVTSVLNSDPPKNPSKTSTRALNKSSSSYNSQTSPTSSSPYGPPMNLSEPDPNFELVPDLIEHTSLLDVILTPTDVTFGDSSKKSSEAVESSGTLSPTKLVSPPRSPNQTFALLRPSTSTSQQTKALPTEEPSLADLMVRASMFETWTPDQEQAAADKGAGSRSSVSSTVHPKAPNDSKSFMMSRTASSPSLSPRVSTPHSPLDSGELKSELMRSLSTASTSEASPKHSTMSLRPVDPILTSLPEGNHSSAILSLAGSASSTPSASGNSWATSFISNSPMFPDLDWNFLNGNYTRDQLFNPAPTNPLKTGWRILCLDGGGVRGLSMLYLVRELMLSIQTHLRLERTPLPCEIFEMICGVGTGGIIALLLGRLRLDVSLAIPAYLQIVSQVFGHSKGVIAAVRRTTRFSASRLEAVIQEVVNRIAGTPELTLADKTNGTACRTFVISTRTSGNKGERVSFTKLRSYPHASMSADTCSIAHAARATSAAPLFFKPPKLNDEDNRLDFVPTDTTVNNPSIEAIAEAQTLFPGRPIDCLVSMGAGSGINPGSGSIARACSEMLESCDRTAQEVQAKSSRSGWSDKYFRLAVKGLKNEDNRGEWQNPESVKAGTSSYIFVQEQDKFKNQVETLSNSWKGAYDEEVFKSMKKVDNKMSTTPHSAIFPTRQAKLSTELLLRRTVSQMEMQVKPDQQTTLRLQDQQATLMSPSSVSVGGADFKRSSTIGGTGGTSLPKLSSSSLDPSSNLHDGVDVKPHLTDPSHSRFLTDLKLPEFDFSKA